MAVASGKRDLEQTRSTVGEWLAGKLGVDKVEISDLSLPKAGYSNETIFLTAQWEQDGQTHREEQVLRIEPTGHQVFRQPDAIFQARMMDALGRHPGTPAPKILFTETDPMILGAPFFLMKRSYGRIPGDVPSWHKKGWTTELTEAEVAQLYDEGLRRLVELHRIDWHDGFEFLDQGRSGRALAAYLSELQETWEWCGSSRRDPEELERAYRYLQDHAPDDRREGIVWGDARPGNLMYSEDLEVTAMLDWETATIGPPGIDLGWWLTFEEFLSEAQGFPRLAGVPDRDGIVARYEQISGHPEPDIDYYEMLACVVLALINSKLADSLIKNHGMTEEVAGEFARRCVRMATRHLSDLTAGS